MRKPDYRRAGVKLWQGDCLELLQAMPDASVNCCVTSPPYYGLRDYGHEGQLGLESTPDEYVAAMTAVFAEVRRVLKDDGTLWLNIGDSYASTSRSNDAKTKAQREKGSWRTSMGGVKQKNLLGIPWRVAFSLQAEGWYLRQDIIWHKLNPMPESCPDRCGKAHEYIFLMSKSAKYYFDGEAIAEESTTKSWTGVGRGGYSEGAGRTDARLDKIPTKMTRNKRSVWTLAMQPFEGAHYAVFPPKLIEPCILAGCPKGGIVLDPFMGSGTTAMVSIWYDRRAVGFDLSLDAARLRLTEAIDNKEVNDATGKLFGDVPTKKCRVGKFLPRKTTDG